MILAITQARTTSSRLPGKVMMKINGKSLLQMHIERISKSCLINKYIIATTSNKQDDTIIECLDKLGVAYYRGDEQNVLSRYYLAAKEYKADHIVRLTADCPLIDPQIIDAVIQLYLNEGADYVSNTLSPSFPDGMDVEVFSFSALEQAYKQAQLQSDKEHVTPFIWRNSTFKGETLFKSVNFNANKDYSSFRLTVDETADFILIEKLVKDLSAEVSWLEYVNYMVLNNIQLNKEIKRNEGYQKSLDNDDNKL